MSFSQYVWHQSGHYEEQKRRWENNAGAEGEILNHKIEPCLYEWRNDVVVDSIASVAYVTLNAFVVADARNLRIEYRRNNVWIWTKVPKTKQRSREFY
jgi:hypothetical protein